MTSSAVRLASPLAVLAMAATVATVVTSTSPVPAGNPARVHAGKVAAPVAPFFQNNAGRTQQNVFAIPGADAEKQATFKMDGHYESLRKTLRWVDVKMGEARLKTPDMLSRLVLAQSAAQRAGLDEVGLSHRDVYGIINAETSWIPRMGASKDGTPNLGIAQFEPATAKALGLHNPHDPVEAVHVAALHMKQAAVWSARRLEGLKLPPAVYAAKLREGVSIYYNLSTKGRNKWNGVNTKKLPIETQRHISNAARGAQEAATLESQLAEFRKQDRQMVNNTRAGIVRTGG